jgi:hypothetical protein
MFMESRCITVRPDTPVCTRPSQDDYASIAHKTPANIRLHSEPYTKAQSSATSLGLYPYPPGVVVEATNSETVGLHGLIQVSSIHLTVYFGLEDVLVALLENGHKFWPNRLEDCSAACFIYQWDKRWRTKKYRYNSHTAYISDDPYHIYWRSPELTP